ncbi:hypothetical protein F25303_6191 [Fusarium sp. NRRL 25303]|nr:hypothetical protein F25303_6191 [Fusarium sp. NRRL 25303]
MDAYRFVWDEDPPHFDEAHLHIRSECGLCCQTIHPNEWAIAHCYCLFLQTYPKKPVLERLWVAAVWRTPWIMSSLKPKIQLDVVDNELVSISLPTAQILGLPQLTALPSEVLQLIKAYSRGSVIWSYPAIKARAEEMAMFDERMSESDDMQYELSIVKKWHRGQDAELDENPPESVVFRFTLDSHGLLDIERLPNWPEYESCRYRTHKYFLIGFAEAQRTWVYFKFGHARMIPSPSWPRPLQFWDIPSPPTKGLEFLLRPRRTDATCNRTLDLRNIMGITFFYYRGTLMGLHSHALGAVTAFPTVKDTLSKYEPYLVWIYIPIPHGDRIMRFGLRAWRNEHEEPATHHTALLMTTKLGGDFSLGPSFDMEDQNFLFQGTPTVLVHNTPIKGGITLLGLAGDEPQETLPAARFPIISISSDQLAYGGNDITVDISLKGAVRIDIFRHSYTGHLRGFLLEYENGSQRTAGQCRVGVDPVTVCHKPVSFCYRKIPGGEFDEHKYYELLAKMTRSSMLDKVESRLEEMGHFRARDMSDHSLPDAPQSPRDLSYDPDRYDWEDFARAGDDWEDQDRHICLHDQCDLCLLDMAPDDLAIADFPPARRSFSLMERVGFYAGMLNAISHLKHYTHDNPLNGVWIATEWRHYFNPRLGFKLQDSSLVSVSPSIAESLGIPQLAQLPPSLVQDIRSMSPDSQVWAYLAIKDRAEGISSAAGQDDLSCMLDKVESWTRGEGAPVMSDSYAGDWSFRVTIDRRGIRNIERIVGISSYAGWRSESLAFALIPPDQAMRSCVDFRLGVARLDLWGGRSVLWDTPSPPSGSKVSWFTASGPSQLCNVRLRTLDLRSTRGLTFVYIGSSLRAIHSHTSRFPTALTTYARLPEHDRQRVVWAYVPNSPSDRVIGLGIRTSGTKGGFASPSVVIRTELAGDIVIGPQPKPVHHDLPLVLIKDYSCDIIAEFFAYGLPDIDGEYMLLAVAGESSEPNAESTRRFPPKTLSTITHSCSCTLLQTRVPLQGTTRIDVFTCKATGLCRGIIFGYEDDAQRAVGQCRIGIDNVTTYINLTRICYSDMMRAHCCDGDDDCSNEEHDSWEEMGCTAHQGSRVECCSGTDGHHHNDSDEHVVCVPIEGYLDCHWDDRWTRLDIQEHAPEAVAAIMQVDMNGRNPRVFTV